MTVRQRQRRTQAQTSDTAWLRRRDELLRYVGPDGLVDLAEFWTNEPDVPDELRDTSPRYRRLRVTGEIDPDLDAKWRAIRAGRRAWLAEHDYR